jgi:hypothetical protein
MGVPRIADDGLAALAVAVGVQRLKRSLPDAEGLARASLWPALHKVGTHGRGFPPTT